MSAVGPVMRPSAGPMAADEMRRKRTLRWAGYRRKATGPGKPPLEQASRSEFITAGVVEPPYPIGCSTAGHAFVRRDEMAHSQAVNRPLSSIGIAGKNAGNDV